MSSAIQSALTSLQQNNYVTLAVLTVLWYDYAVTLSNEIEYIWNKPWTWVSTLYILVRYVGIYNLTTSSLVGSSFLPGPAKSFTGSSLSVLHGYVQGRLIYLVNGWTFPFFLGAADFVTTLRVWAMYNRSRLVLGTLLVLFSLEMVLAFITIALDSKPNNLPAVTIKILDFSFCSIETTQPTWIKLTTIVQITYGGIMCMLALFQFMKQSFQMYRATKQWQLNRYMSLFAKQGILYFLAIFLFALINVLYAVGSNLPTGGWQLIVLLIVELIPMYTLIPRFILSMRELYARDVQVGSKGGIDSGFGLSVSGLAGAPMVFADVEQNEDVEEPGMPMEVRSQPE